MAQREVKWSGKSSLNKAGLLRNNSLKTCGFNTVQCQAVAIKTKQEHEQLRKWLRDINIEVTLYAPGNPVMVIVDRKEKLEAELWLKPDGITFDNETLKRRKKAKLNKNLTAWIISPEDFIINKLARPDRGAVDEQDVKSVLIRQAGKLDNKYLTKRAQQADVLTILQSI